MNLDSVNFCTSKAISMELWHFPSVLLPPANSFVIGTVVINTHTLEDWLTESRFVIRKSKSGNRDPESHVCENQL
jgi:hypothetical protein